MRVPDAVRREVPLRRAETHLHNVDPGSAAHRFALHSIRATRQLSRAHPLVWAKPCQWPMVGRVG